MCVVCCVLCVVCCVLRVVCCVLCVVCCVCVCVCCVCVLCVVCCVLCVVCCVLCVVCCVLCVCVVSVCVCVCVCCVLCVVYPARPRSRLPWVSKTPLGPARLRGLPVLQPPTWAGQLVAVQCPDVALGDPFCQSPSDSPSPHKPRHICGAMPVSSTGAHPSHRSGRQVRGRKCFPELRLFGIKRVQYARRNTESYEAAIRQAGGDGLRSSATAIGGLLSVSGRPAHGISEVKGPGGFCVSQHRTS